MDDFRLLMSTAASVLKNNKRARAALGCGVLAFALVIAMIGGMSWLAAASSPGDGGDAAASGQEAPADGGDAADGASSPSASESLSPNQADAAAATSAVEDAEPADLLRAYSWADVTTGTGYTFGGDGNMSSTSGEAKAYTISDAKRSDPSSSAYSEGGGETTVTKTVYTFVISLAGTEARGAVLTVMEYADGRAPTLTLSSSAFNHDLAASAKDQAVSIEDPTDGAGLAQVMGDKAALEAALSTWCQAHAVGTTKATWDGRCTVDYSLSTSTVSLKLDNAARKTVTCVRNADGGYTFYF